MIQKTAAEPCKSPPHARARPHRRRHLPGTGEHTHKLMRRHTCTSSASWPYRALSSRPSRLNLMSATCSHPHAQLASRLPLPPCDHWHARRGVPVSANGVRMRAAEGVRVGLYNSPSPPPECSHCLQLDQFMYAGDVIPAKCCEKRSLQLAADAAQVLEDRLPGTIHWQICMQSAESVSAQAWQKSQHMEGRTSSLASRVCITLPAPRGEGSRKKSFWQGNAAATARAPAFALKASACTCTCPRLATHSLAPVFTSHSLLPRIHTHMQTDVGNFTRPGSVEICWGRGGGVCSKRGFKVPDCCMFQGGNERVGTVAICWHYKLGILVQEEQPRLEQAGHLDCTAVSTLQQQHVSAHHSGCRCRCNTPNKVCRDTYLGVVPAHGQAHGCIGTCTCQAVLVSKEPTGTQLYHPPPTPHTYTRAHTHMHTIVCNKAHVTRAGLPSPPAAVAEARW